MTLNTLRHILLFRGGEIRAWALTEQTRDRIAADLGPRASSDPILGIPVVIVQPGDPEGVIV